MVNITVMQSEADRIRQLALSLTELATDLRAADPESWRGEGRNGFARSRDAQAGQCRRAADAHFSASNALHEYVTALTELRNFDRVGGTTWQHEHLTAQLDNATHAVTRALRQAHEELMSLRATLSETVTPVAVPELTGIAAPPEPRHSPSTAVIAQVLDPNQMHRDPIRFDNELQKLSDTMFDHWSGLAAANDA